MQLFTDAQYELLLKNGGNPDKDHPPVAVLFLTNTRCVWLLNEINPQYPDQAFGLCDLGMGFPELGYVSLEEMTLTQSEADFVHLINLEDFKANYPMSVYQKAARQNQHITINETALRIAAGTHKPQ